MKRRSILQALMFAPLLVPLMKVDQADLDAALNHNTLLDDGEWHFVLATKPEGDTPFTFYVDGVETNEPLPKVADFLTGPRTASMPKLVLMNGYPEGGIMTIGEAAKLTDAQTSSVWIKGTNA